MKTLTTSLTALFLTIALATGCEDPEARDCGSDEQERTERRQGALSIDVDTDQLSDAIDIEEDCTPPRGGSEDGFDDDDSGVTDEGPSSDDGFSDGDDWSDFEDGDDWSDFEDGDDWSDEDYWGCDQGDDWYGDKGYDDCGCDCYGDDDWYWY